jgi:PAS domain S-box-containing protein
MNDSDKSQTHLIQKLRDARQQIAELKTTLASSQETQDSLRDTADAAIHQSQIALREMGILFKAAQGIMEATQLTDICQTLVRHFNDLVSADRTVLFLVDHQQRKILVNLVWGSVTGEIPMTYDDLETGLSGRVFATGQPILSASPDDGVEPEATRDRRFQDNAGPLIVVPLSARYADGTSAVIGTITAINRLDQRTFTDHDVDLLMALTNQAATAIENVRLYKEARQEIAERKRIDQALRQSEVRLKLALDAANDALFDWNMQTDEVYFSPNYYKMVGYEPGDMPAWRAMIHPDDKARVLAATQEIYDRKRDNSVLEYRLKTRSGEDCWVLSRSRVIEKDDQGNPVRLVGTHVNITERKRVEAEREQLIADLNAYAHTVAHDLKTPLVGIMGYSNLLATYFEEEIDHQEAQSLLKEIERSGEKMNEIVDTLLLLASVRQSGIETKPMDMGSIVKETLSNLALIVEDAQARIIMPEANTWQDALGYAPWIEEVWANYISNAIKYGGTPPHIELGATLEDDHMVRYWVRDNGTGIAPTEQARIFDPFTRLDRFRSQGHGLGLSIVKRIVEKLGGQVGVESTPGQGSTFSFTLPAAT